MYELVTESVTLQGQRYQAPRSIQANIITKQGSQTYYRVSEGDTVLLNGKEKSCSEALCFLGRLLKEN